LRSYTASLYSAHVPTDWTQEEDDAQKSGFLESQWRDPAHPKSLIRIDAVSGESSTPAEKAAQVQAVTSTTPGYSEASFGSTTLGGQDAWRWTFDVSATKRVDYFRNDCGTGIAVLGTAAPSDFDSLASTFRKVAGSVSTSCSSGGTSSSSGANGSSGGSSPAQDFCSTHNCIPNFPNGTGYIVQCNDGMWSHSGGRPGACSQHGGESGTTYP
jgi:hypothetical protein